MDKNGNPMLKCGSHTRFNVTLLPTDYLPSMLGEIYDAPNRLMFWMLNHTTNETIILTYEWY